MKCHVIIGHHTAYCTTGKKPYDMYKLQKLRSASASTQANNSPNHVKIVQRFVLLRISYWKRFVVRHFGCMKTLLFVYRSIVFKL